MEGLKVTTTICILLNEYFVLGHVHRGNCFMRVPVLCGLISFLVFALANDHRWKNWAGHVAPRVAMATWDSALGLLAMNACHPSPSWYIRLHFTIPSQNGCWYCCLGDERKAPHWQEDHTFKFRIMFSNRTKVPLKRVRKNLTKQPWKLRNVYDRCAGLEMRYFL